MTGPIILVVLAFLIIVVVPLYNEYYIGWLALARRSLLNRNLALKFKTNTPEGRVAAEQRLHKSLEEAMKIPSWFRLYFLNKAQREQDNKESLERFKTETVNRMMKELFREL